MSNVHVQTSTLRNGTTSPSYEFSSMHDEGIDGPSEMLCRESSSMTAALATASSRDHPTNQIDDERSTTTSCRALQGQQTTTTEGCNETRKLLAHYEKCKELRSRLRQSSAQGKHYPQQSTCLVCSLMARYAKNVTDKSPKKNAHIPSVAPMPPLPRQRPRSESCPEQKSPERKSRSVKFAPCLRTTRYYHVEKDKSFCVSTRPRSASWGSNVLGETIIEESGERECTEDIILPGSL
eukprot:CCRYP_011335-RA/>CCRYP_011335-RA protein AED:0.17 eAED:0.34 QI:1546/0/0.5/1/0/0/2/0/236